MVISLPPLVSINQKTARAGAGLSAAADTASDYPSVRQPDRRSDVRHSDPDIGRVTGGRGGAHSEGGAVQPAPPAPRACGRVRVSGFDPARLATAGPQPTNTRRTARDGHPMPVIMWVSAACDAELTARLTTGNSRLFRPGKNLRRHTSNSSHLKTAGSVKHGTPTDWNLTKEYLCSLDERMGI